jgi:hypothetical protein
MIEIHQPPLVKVIDGMPEDEDGKNGRQRLTVERERHRVLAMSNMRTSRSEPTISSIGSPKSHETRRTRSQDDTDRRRRH